MRLVFGSPDIDDRLQLDMLEVDGPRVVEGECALYVLEGTVKVDGTELPSGGAAILHTGTTIELTEGLRDL